MLTLKIKTIYKIGKWLISIGSLLFIFLKLRNTNFGELELLLLTVRQTKITSTFLALFILMILNWLIEAIKWKLVLNKLQKISILNSIKSVFAGIAFGIVTPNRVGELIGRIIFIEEDKKISASLLNIICSLMQLSVTFIFGLVAIFFFKENWIYKLPFLSIFSLLFLLVFVGFGMYFIFQKTSNIQQKIIEFIEPFYHINSRTLLALFALSIFRYVVFTIQYILILNIFAIDLSFVNSVVCIALNFFLITIIPTYALAEIGIRGTVAVTIFSVYGISSLPVLSASLLIWIINLAIPALIGTLILIKE